MTQLLEVKIDVNTSDLTLGTAIDDAIRPVGASVETASSYLSTNDATIYSLASLSDHKYRLTEAIPVDVTRDDDAFVVTWRGTDDFGFGSSVVEAIRDLQLTLIELFETLCESSDDELSDYLRARRDELKRYITVIQ
jgi:hypothetical protein